jgi:AmiR/NasT family two-component response regulator
MDPAIIKAAMDYGVLGVVVVALAYVLWKAADFIVREFKETQAKCEADRKDLAGKLEARDRAHEATLGGMAREMRETAAQATRALEANAKLPWDRILGLAEREEKRATEPHHNTRRSGEHRH